MLIKVKIMGVLNEKRCKLNNILFNLLCLDNHKPVVFERFFLEYLNPPCIEGILYFFI